MRKPIQANRSQFERDGFTFVHDVLSADEIEIFAPIFSEHLPADKLPPGIPDAGLNGRKTLISEHTDPRLSNLAGHTHLIEAVDTLIGPRFLIQSTSAPVITYKSPPGAERFDQPVKVQDHLYIRDYDKCVLCYKCVDACGEEAQFTFAIAMSGRGFDSRISTEFDVTLPDSACVYCGNCIGVCPTNALQFRSEFDLREANDWREDDQSVTRTVCSYCGVGCNLELHVQDNEIVKVTSPADNEVTHGHLCIKGRFGWKYV